MHRQIDHATKGMVAGVNSLDDKFLRDLDSQSSHIFTDYMTGIAKYDDLVKVGYRLLVGLYQEQQIFRRSQLHKKSDVVDDIINRFDTNRMKEYIEAGCISPHRAVQNVIKLHSFKQGLLEHIKQVSVLINELERLKEDAIGVARQVNQSALDLLDRSPPDELTQLSFAEEETVGDKSILHATMIVAVFRMLKPDFDMQENIIKSLNLNTPSSELETYCQMWDLRPYIDDKVIQQAWKIV